MRFESGLFLSLPVLAVAFPGMMPREEMLKHVKEARDAAPAPAPEADPELISTIVGGLASTVEGLLGSVAEAINPDDLRPEPGYEFQAPGPNDSRGPCPGLNLLANYGYLPRDGHVTAGQVIEATARGFNMGADLATILVTFAVLTDGDLASESWYLGSGPDGVGGLNRHSTVEADISPNREDYYNGCGDNHHLSSRLFKQNVQLVAESSSKEFDMDVMGQHFALTASFAKTYNPYLYYFPFPSIVSFVAFSFYPAFFSNGTFGAGGVANYESISSIIGAEFDKASGEFKYVPERWPDNWYRRSTPYGAVQALTDGLVNIYAKNPVAMPIAQLGTDNLDAATILCDLYQGLDSATPLALSGSEEEVASAVTWALGLLDPYFKDTVLGCPTDTISKNSLFPNASSEGGPLNPPAAVTANAGNNVYNKIYFTEAPKEPQC